MGREGPGESPPHNPNLPFQDAGEGMWPGDALRGPGKGRPTGKFATRPEACV